MRRCGTWQGNHHCLRPAPCLATFGAATRIATKREQTLEQARIARVAADPAPFAEAAIPGGWPGFRYYRLHGSPRIYHSAYGDDWLASLAERLAEAPKGIATWCIFDNTANGAAIADALVLQPLLGAH